MQVSSQPQASVWATGFAMFSMFFGAGNIVFPLALGQYAQSQNFYAILGLLITAVGVPFLGLIAMTLFDGNYRQFFNRIGNTPGFLVIAIIMGLIGPFGALPRCIALSYSTLKMYLPNINLPLFSLFSCLIIYLLTFRRNKIIDVLGYVLTPFLLISLGIIILKGLTWHSETILPTSHHDSLFMFLTGLNEGYQTMDLLGAFFFCSVILTALKQGRSPSETRDCKKTILLTLKASCIGATLLGLIYIGFSYLAALQAENLKNVSKDELLGTIAHQILGPYAGIVVSIAVALACLTTAIALAAVFSEFFQISITQNKINYKTALILTLIISFAISTLKFMGIVAFLAPILQVCYPALIMLCFVNIGYKLYRFQSVKIPVMAVFLLSLIHYALT